MYEIFSSGLTFIFYNLFFNLPRSTKIKLLYFYSLSMHFGLQNSTHYQEILLTCLFKLFSLVKHIFSTLVSVCLIKNHLKKLVTREIAYFEFVRILSPTCIIPVKKCINTLFFFNPPKGFKIFNLFYPLPKKGCTNSSK